MPFPYTFGFTIPGGSSPEPPETLSALPNTNTTTYLLASLKRRGMLPDSNRAFSETDLLAFADEELQTTIVKELLAVREEYLLAKSPYEVTLDADTEKYALPERAIAGRLRQVLVSGTSNTYALIQAGAEDDLEYGNGGGSPVAFAFDGNYVKPLPIGGSGTLKMKYFIRPNRLVSTSAVGLISAINTGTNTITCSSVPSNFTTNELYDFVKGRPGFDCPDIDCTISAVTTGTNGTMTFESALPTDLRVGDYVAFAQQSPIPQVPVELHPWLSQRVVCRAMEATGDKAGLQAAEATSERMRLTVLSLISDRDQGSARLIINKHGPGFKGRRGFWRW